MQPKIDVHENTSHIWRNKHGLWLRVGQRTTHTGHHIDVEYVANPLLATPMARLDEPYRRHREIRNQELNPVRVKIRMQRELIFLDPVEEANGHFPVTVIYKDNTGATRSLVTEDTKKFDNSALLISRQNGTIVHVIDQFGEKLTPQQVGSTQSW